MPTSSLLATLIRRAHALLGSAFVGFAVFMLANAFVLTGYHVDGRSMEPTLEDGQLIGISPAAYYLYKPQMGDIVVVRYSEDASVRMVKRIAGLPGDTVTVQGRPYQLGPIEYYLLGDNQAHSTDSRTYGPIRRDQIIGKVVLPRAK